MKRLLLFLVLATAANAQTQLTVTATNIHGPNGVPYAFGTAHASTNCTGNAQAYIGTTPIPRDTPTVGLDGFAGFSQVLYNTAIMVDVNQNPLVCNYIYHVIDQCGIAAFAASVTGVTGAGPVDLSSQINAVAVNVSPQCGGAGGVSAIYEHNGTVVGQEPRYNFIDSGSVTATFVDNPGANRVDLTLASAGGGTGCTLPGHDTGVLTEHPLGHCYNSLDYTWDDTTPVAGTNGHIFLAGDGTNSVSAGSGTDNYREIFFFGDHNTAPLGTPGLVGTNGGEEFSFGDHNLMEGCFTCVAFGSTNDMNATSPMKNEYGNIAIGYSNNLGNSTVYVFGDTNTVVGNEVVDIGVGSQIAPSATGNAAANTQHSIFAEIGATLNLTSNSAQAIDIEVLGSADTFNVGASDEINCIHGVGGANTMTMADRVSGSPIFENISWVGKTNTWTSDGTTSISVMEVSGVGNQISGNVSNSDIFGNYTTMTGCADCYIVGENVTLSAGSNTLAMGMSASAEIVVTPGAVDITAWPVSKVIAFTYCAAGCTLTGTPCTTGSSSYNTCTDTINFVSLGTFVDAGYVAACTGVGPADPGNPGNIGRAVFQGVVSKTASSIGLNTATQGSSAVHFSGYDCTLTHR